MDRPSSNVVVKRVPVEIVRPIRAEILRPNQPPDACVYPEDNHGDSLHFGAYINGKLIGIASFYHEAPSGQPDVGAWRLRGMATLESTRRTGVGSNLLETGMEYVAAAGGTSLWCNARATAADFYETQGLKKSGVEFELPDIGPHWFMSRPIASE